MYVAESSRIGSAVGVHTSPVASSRMYSTSPGVSKMWSFDQGVSWFSWLFTDQVNPEPDSETRNPKFGFAITLTHGSGVRAPSPRTVTYSRPSCAKPPSPLKNLRDSCGRPTSFCCGGGATPGPRGGRSATFLRPGG